MVTITTKRSNAVDQQQGWVADIIDRGILVAGGGGILPGLTHALAEAAGLPVLLTENPTECVARGVDKLMVDPGAFDQLAL